MRFNRNSKLVTVAEVGLKRSPEMRTYILAFLTLSTAALLACGGSQPAPNPPTADTDGGVTPATSKASGDVDASVASTTPAEKPAAAPSESTFEALSTDKKVEIMMAKVVPNVGKLFKEQNAKKFGKFNCATCHGAAKEKSKEDPHKVLPKLTFSNGGYEKLTKEKPEMMKFMNEKVVPTMAEALGEKPYDKATKKGFGCRGCHTVD
jgi:hypothetical protein